MSIVQCPQCGTKNRIDEQTAAERKPVCGRCGASLVGAATASSPSRTEPLVVTDATFARDVLGASGPVVVDCWAPWCGPCRMLAPTLDALAAESNGRYLIAKLNTDENRATAGQFQIDAIPTLLFFKSGQLIDRVAGLQPKAAIAQRLAAMGA